MANWGVKGQTFAPFAFLLYLCIVFPTVEQASSTPNVRYGVKIQNKRRIICVIQTFVVSLQRLFERRPVSADTDYIFEKSNTPIRFTEISQVSQESYSIGGC